MYNSNYPISDYFVFVAKLKEVYNQGGRQIEINPIKVQDDVKKSTEK